MVLTKLKLLKPIKISLADGSTLLLYVDDDIIATNGATGGSPGVLRQFDGPGSGLRTCRQQQRLAVALPSQHATIAGGGGRCVFRGRLGPVP